MANFLTFLGASNTILSDEDEDEDEYVDEDEDVDVDTPKEEGLRKAEALMEVHAIASAAN